MTPENEPPRRLKVVMSAYGCDPTGGSEPGAGWGFATAAARHHDVWVFAHPRWEPAISAVLEQDSALAAHLHMHYVSLGPTLTRLRRRPADLYWYYVLWQRRIGKLAVRLHEVIGFDVAHHVTFANDWLPARLTDLPDVPLVWGPVGGASRVPIRRLSRWLGPRGLAIELGRLVSTGALRKVWADPVAKSASVVIAQNDAVARRFHRARRVEVEPNCMLDPMPSFRSGSERSGKTALFVGRLTAWKGVRLAVAVMAHPSVADWQLKFVGDGAERDALERLTVELGVADRVHFAGHLPRDKVLGEYARADALLFPSFHDQAGWVVAEASASGCPVVCLPLGGPPILADENGYVASLDGDIVENVAHQLVRAAEQGGAPHERWSRDRLPALVDEWYAAALRDGRSA